jgi:hypothetical protein
MSFLVKGGYDIIRKQVVNISLKRTTKWTRGLLFVGSNKYLSSLNPTNENILELVRHDNMHALVLNNAIIYEDNKLFAYKIDLQCEIEPDLTDKNLYNFMDYNYANIKDLRYYNTIRTLN